MERRYIIMADEYGAFIAHSRTKGSVNGVRNYQNLDGTWTEEGKERRREQYAQEHPGSGRADYERFKRKSGENLTRDISESYKRTRDVVKAKLGEQHARIQKAQAAHKEVSEIRRAEQAAKNKAAAEAKREAAEKRAAELEAQRKAAEEERAKQAKEKEDAEKAAAEAAELERRNKLKMHIREHPEDIFKYRLDLPKEDVEEVAAQIKWDTEIKSISDAEHKRNRDKLKSIVESADQIIKAGSTAVNMYNMGADIFNSVLEAKQMAEIAKDGKIKTNKNKLPTISLDSLTGRNKNNGGGDKGGNNKNGPNLSEKEENLIGYLLQHPERIASERFNLGAEATKVLLQRVKDNDGLLKAVDNMMANEAQRSERAEAEAKKKAAASEAEAKKAEAEAKKKSEAESKAKPKKIIDISGVKKKNESSSSSNSSESSKKKTTVTPTPSQKPASSSSNKKSDSSRNSSGDIMTRTWSDGFTEWIDYSGSNSSSFYTADWSTMSWGDIQRELGLSGSGSTYEGKHVRHFDMMTDGGFLAHFGILGQKKGQRNYQYEDGTYTPEGRERYGIGPPRKKKDAFDMDALSKQLDSLNDDFLQNGMDLIAQYRERNLW